MAISERFRGAARRSAIQIHVYFTLLYFTTCRNFCISVDNVGGRARLRSVCWCQEYRHQLMSEVLHSEGVQCGTVASALHDSEHVLPAAERTEWGTASCAVVAFSVMIRVSSTISWLNLLFYTRWWEAFCAAQFMQESIILRQNVGRYGHSTMNVYKRN